MSYVVDHWSFDPFLVLAVALVALHEAGLARLRRGSTAERTRGRRRRSLLFYAGLGVLLLAVASPIDHWASSYFFMHMIEHLLLSFYAPMLIVASAPWTPLAEGVPVAWRRGVRRLLATGAAAPLRRLGTVLGSPWFAVLSLNVVMVLWHVPVLFDAAETNRALHVWGMHASLFATGVLFWLVLIPSQPFRLRASPAFQAGAIIATNLVMFVLAVSMSLFASASWYAVYRHVPGVTFPAFADQQLGAAILWICGDFWAVPALVIVLRRAIEAEGSLADAVDRAFHRPTTPGLRGIQGPAG